MKKNGFTLVEILVVMGIIAIIGTILVVIFANTLRGNNKAQVLANIKQNGQAVMDNLEKAIRSSDDLVCPASYFPGNTLVLVHKGVYTRYRIMPASTDRLSSKAPGECFKSDGAATGNGCISQDKPIKDIIEETGKLETDTEFIDRICGPDSIMNDPKYNPIVLTDTRPQTGVQVNKAVMEGMTKDFFDVHSEAGYKNAVTVAFTLEPAPGASSAIITQVDRVLFQTTVQLR